MQHLHSSYKVSFSKNKENTEGDVLDLKCLVDFSIVVRSIQSISSDLFFSFRPFRPFLFLYFLCYDYG